MAGDDVRRLSDELARDPSSLAFLQLAEILRRQGQPDMARKVAIRGLQRHPHNAEAHDLLARIESDLGDTQKAADEWDMALRLDPAHAGANKGLGFLCYMQQRFADAEGYLAAAHAADPDDDALASALELVREHLQGRGSRVEGREGAEPEQTTIRPSTFDVGTVPSSASDARALFADLTADGRHAALLLDASGLVMAGAYAAADGRDVGQEIGAELSGVSDEARRAMRHLDLGDWSSIVLEAEAAIVAMAPAPDDALLLVAAERSTPLGFVRRVLDRAGERARAWLPPRGSGA